MVKTSIFFVFLASLDTQGPTIGVISFCLRFAFAKIEKVVAEFAKEKPKLWAL